MQLSCPFLSSFNGKYPSLMKPGISMTLHSICPHCLKWLLLFILPTLVKLNNKIFTTFTLNYQAMQKCMTSELKALLGVCNLKLQALRLPKIKIASQ